ncbi:MAG: hypothetical protein QOI80_1267 [Solirubrobacteraceae bacterium]|jgi:uncharacterized RDD family membrane protein YckC|nr:hypothetical protein [Solirubrobacteraceae bacterium]
MPTQVVGRRVAAFLIDGIVVTAINAAIFFAFAKDKTEAALAGDLTAGDTTYINVTLGDKHYAVFGSKAALYFLITFLIWFGYSVVWPGLKGVTLGKLAMGIKIVKDDGTEPPGIGRALARWFLLIADGFPYIIPYLTGFIVALNSKQNKRIGDMVAGTIVVKRDAEVSPTAAPAPPPGIPFQS